MSASELSGIVKQWKIHVYPRKLFNEEGLSIDSNDCLAVMTGVVVKDFKNRWGAGTAMKSSLITKFNLQTMTIVTLNSTYQLQGVGLVEPGKPGRYDFEVGRTILELMHLQSDDVER